MFNVQANDHSNKMEQARSFSDMLTCRIDKNAWLGVTEGHKIGFFKSEHVEEVLDENVDGRYKSIIRLPLLSRWLNLPV